MSEIDPTTVVEFHHPEWPDDTARAPYHVYVSNYRDQGFLLTGEWVDFNDQSVPESAGPTTRTTVNTPTVAQPAE